MTKIFKGLALATALIAGGAAHAQDRLTMGATHSASSFYAYQVGITNFLNTAVGNVNINVRELGGAEVSTEALLRGEVDMGISVTSSDFAAMNGVAPFTGKADNLRTLYYFAPLPLNFVVAADAGVDDVDGLAGKAFNPGGRGTSTERQVEQIMETIGVTPDWLRAEGGDALDGFQNGRIVGFVKGGNHPDGYIQQAASARDIVFLSLDEEQRNKVIGAYPFFSVAKSKPSDFYGQTEGEVATLQTAIGINTTSNLDEETAYQIAKAVFSDAGKQAASEVYAPAKSIDAAQLTIDAAVAPLHKGVIRYLEESGYTVPDDLKAQD
ncbi:TAXI family TRAP transporter solute-binding subunit [Hoeflea sp.]|uniref:TAXI family TRAP transporter solute-binding subunit n=1 Tax=Hoeflea sp. TaxID=1940281 RepID=UPI0019930019|nr:TAXI family TRAP transporter solute-binding subunit [Hoeflea sp.]MBC7284925.1 TAXI family TRAP transporter solute-binding subunit [Hoeflea sp.]